MIFHVPHVHLGIAVHCTGFSSQGSPVLTQVLHGQTTDPVTFPVVRVLGVVAQLGIPPQKCHPDLTPLCASQCGAQSSASPTSAYAHWWLQLSSQFCSQSHVICNPTDAAGQPNPAHHILALKHTSRNCSLVTHNNHY